MPRYDFRCRQCEQTFEVTRPMSAAGDPAPLPRAGTPTRSSCCPRSPSAGAAPAPGGAAAPGWRWRLLRRRLLLLAAERAAGGRPVDGAGLRKVDPVAAIGPGDPEPAELRRERGEPTKMTTLASGSSLAAGQSITSDNGKYKLELQADGNLVLSGAGGRPGRPDTAGKDGARVDMQADGNFVLYSADNGVVWRTDTADKPGAHLVLQDDRNIVIYAADGTTVLWSPNTYLTEAEKAADAQQEAEAKAKADADAAAAAAAAAPPPAPAAPAHQTYTVVRGRHPVRDREALLRQGLGLQEDRRPRTTSPTRT